MVYVFIYVADTIIKVMKEYIYEIIDVDELLGSYIFDEKRLNDTIEIIGEEGKKIPEKFKINYEIDEENTINMEKATMLECDLACRINEIIDYLKEKENK